MRILSRSAVLCGAVFSVSTVFSATNPPPVGASDHVVTNAPIIVTASRAGRTVAEMPADVTVITAKDIQDSGAQDVVAALENLGGVYFRNNSDNPGLAEISMRGFGENSFGRVLVLVDGQRLNGADMSELDWLRIPVGTVERIEVLHGGQTALYGNYAVAGIVNIITHQPSETPVTTVSAMAGSYGTLAAHAGHDGSVSNVSYTADVDWRRSDGYRDNSQYRNADARAAVSEDWTERLRTELSAFYTDNTYGMPGDLTLAEMRANPRQTFTPDDHAQTKTFGGSLGGSGDIGADGRLDCDFAATHRTIASDTVSYSYYFNSTLDTYSITPRYTLDTDVDGYRNRFLVGMDFVADTLDLHAYDDPVRTLKNTDATLDRVSSGAYAQDEFFFTRKTSLLLGARGDMSRYSSDVLTNFTTDISDRADKTFRQAALDAALLYHPTDAMKLFARAATLYRDPFLDEMTTTDPMFLPPGALPMNTSLKPEVGQQAEVGAAVDVAKEWTAECSAYRLDMQDEIAYDAMTEMNGNLDQTRRYGVDSALTWRRSGVGLFSFAYNYVDARFSAGPDDHKRIPLVPAHNFSVRGEKDLPGDLTLIAAGHGAGNQFLGGDDANAGAKLPPYATLDLGLRYHPHQIPGLDILFGVDNVFDHTYANQGYYGFGFGDAYYPAAGRTWKLGATYRF